MILGRGVLKGRGIYQLNGSFTLTRSPSGDIVFETSEDFEFSDGNGRGTPDPGFAFFKGDPTGLSPAVVSPAALATRFLNLSADIATTGRQLGSFRPTAQHEGMDTLFLWCFKFPTVLGVAPIEFVDGRTLLP